MKNLEVRHPLGPPQPHTPDRVSLIASSPQNERPRERCLEQGAHALSLRECLALILGSGPPQVGALGLANQIVKRATGVNKLPGISGVPELDEDRAVFTAFENSGASVLQRIPGLGPAAQAKLLATFEFGRRYANYRMRPTQRVPSNPTELSEKILAKVPLSARTAPQEWMGFICIYRNGEIGELGIVEKGVRTHVNFDSAELFARVLAFRPAGFALIHNHPSGALTPSPDDLILTQSVAYLARKLGLSLVGHGIVSAQGAEWIHP